MAVRRPSAAGASLRALAAALAATLAAALTASAEVLPDDHLSPSLAVFGDDFLIEEIDAPEITDPARWTHRPSGEYVYRFVGTGNGEPERETQRLRLDEPSNSWTREIGGRFVERFYRQREGSVFVIEETDSRSGYRVETSSDVVRWPTPLAPGQRWQEKSDLTAWRSAGGELAARGELQAEHRYEGAWRVRTPAGDFDAILLSEDYSVRLGLVSAEDDRLLFFARDVGLVAELEGIRASALLVFRQHDKRAKVLESYPRP